VHAFGRFFYSNIAGAAAIDEISSTLTSETENSALLKHELAYCLGQIADERAVDVLIRVLDNTHENPMVRHEAGE
jgi:deoxyhypusine monooxygenase